MSFRGIMIEQTIVKGRIREHSAQLCDLSDGFLETSGGDKPVDIDVLYSGVNLCLAVLG